MKKLSRSVPSAKLSRSVAEIIRAETEKIKASRTGFLSALTKKMNDVRRLATENGNIEEVKKKLQEAKESIDTFEKACDVYWEVLDEPGERKKRSNIIRRPTRS
ncbi:predicted protein [Nematostella vectensis]|uniref:Uncharacterized protein n=1 Tax=Nematostella vectensis TaxID=45351 RepID=A7SLV4_NEMVE|nr:predicted protein [Nematostella vectensis]|eukprot:XP_001627422.1 predicted protein [Nematostella vectensis]